MRTTELAVSKIIKVKEAIDLAPFIEAANSLVTAICTSTALTTAQLELIERWLSAHFYAIRDPRRSMERAGDVAESFRFKVDLALNQTTYGQQAMLLDSSGALAAYNEQSVNGRSRVAVVAWLGTEECA